MEKYITELLDNNVRVVLPDLGAFIVKQRKPLKIIFNEFLKYNDGLLIEYVAKSANINKDEATKQVTTYVDSVKEKLNKNENITVQGLGILNKDQAGNIAFNLAKDTQVKTETTSIKTDKKTKSKEETKEVKKEEIKEIKKEEPKAPSSPTPPPIPPKKTFEAQQSDVNQSSAQSVSYTSNRYTKKSSDDESKRVWLWLIAVVMAILIVVLILNISEKSKKSKKELAKKETSAPVTDEEVTQPEEEIAAEEETLPSAPKTIKPVVTSAGKRYHIIAGCFKVPSNADNYVIFLRKKGYPAEKLGVFNGYHVVSFNSYPTKREALNQLNVIREEYETEAWLKKY